MFFIILSILFAGNTAYGANEVVNVNVLFCGLYDNIERLSEPEMCKIITSVSDYCLEPDNLLKELLKKVDEKLTFHTSQIGKINKSTLNNGLLEVAFGFVLAAGVYILAKDKNYINARRHDDRFLLVLSAPLMISVVMKSAYEKLLKAVYFPHEIYYKKLCFIKVELEQRIQN